MKKIAAFLALFLSLSFAQGNQGNNNGVGLWLSNYGWGFDLKHLNNNNTVWDVYLGGGLGFSSRGYASIGLDVGYYFLFPNVIKADAATVGKFPLHWGPNIGFGYWTSGDRPNRHRNLLIAPNVALGISWFVPTPFKWDVSIELFPGLRIGRVSDEQSNGSWGSETEFGLGVDLRLLFHFYLF